MLIRPANRTDAKGIARNNMTLARETEDIHIKYEESLAGTTSLIDNREKGFYLIAEEDQEIIGQMLVTFEWSDWRNKNIWWIHRIFVKEKWRKKDVFKQLINELKRRSFEENVFAIRLYVSPENRDAINTYEKIGMEKAPFLIYQQVLI
jgi:GNAT superfamily N-acetyltransferase